MTRFLPTLNPSWRDTLDLGSKATSVLLGGTVVVLAVGIAATATSPAEVASWAGRMFGPSFLVLFAGLILASVFCWLKLIAQPGRKLWLQAGLQAANGLTTLALTYTLFGISLGVGSLAEHTLTPETVQVIVRELTAKFSLAFMTTVVGLPASAVLRTLLLITHARAAETATEQLNEGDD